MNITFLLTQDLQSPTGVGRCWPLAAELTRLGHQIQILALHPNWDELQQKHQIIDEISIRYVAPMHVIKKGSTKGYYSPTKLLSITALATQNLTSAALRVPTDILHVCKPHPMNSLAGWLCSKIRSRLLFLDCDDYEAGSGNFSVRWQKHIVAQFEKWVPKQVHTVTTNTWFMHQKLVNWGVPENRLVYLSNGVDQRRFKKVDYELLAAIQRQLDLQGKPVIGYIGSLSLANHAVDLLVHAFAQVYQRDSAASLLIVGAGEDNHLLQSQIKQLGIEKAVLWTGRVAPELVPTYYQLCTVSVDPVRNDDACRGRSPLKLFESWACNVPFVTGDVGDRKLLLGEPPAGLLAEPGDIDSLAENILSVLHNPGLADQLRLRGQERLVNYTWDRLAAQLDGVYQSALDSFNRKRSNR